MPNTIRWAINIHRWTPGREEWCAAMRRVQTQGKERARIREFKYFHDAKASLAGRLLLRLLWFRCCGGAEGQGDAVFSRSSKGRPRLENCSWDFNVSHQGSFVVLAAEKDDLGGEFIIPLWYLHWDIVAVLGASTKLPPQSRRAASSSRSRRDADVGTTARPEEVLQPHEQAVHA